MNLATSRLYGQTPEWGLEQFGLTESLIHDCVRPAWVRSRARSSLATSGAAGTDLYLDISENLATSLSELGWQRVRVQNQQRMVHPDGVIAIAVSSAVDVANSDPKKHPRTQSKGPATLGSLGRERFPGQKPFDLDEFQNESEVEKELDRAPLWLLLHETLESEVRLSLAHPVGSDRQGNVVDFGSRVNISPLRLDADLEIFRNDDEGDGIDFDVSVI